MRPRLLDLYCGAGGASVGYHRAGFDVVGVDIRPQPNYPFEFHRLDAFDAFADVPRIESIVAVHASPPCQTYIRGGLVAKDGRHPDLLGQTRAMLERQRRPWVIENVPGAPMRADALLCGSQFGLQVRRHRLFEFSWNEPMLVWPCDHSQRIAGVYGHPHGLEGAAPGMLAGDRETWSRAMGIAWMNAAELADAVPPAYTELIGHQLMQQIRSRAA